MLDALIAGVNIVELDPEETSVGYGGLPNADGVVQLDSCCMHGPKKRAGGVAALEGVRTPSLVAQAVMNETDHHLIVGKGAQEFARSLGFKIEDDLNTERSRAAWLRWKRETDPLHYLDPASAQEALRRVELQMIAEGLIEPEHLYGTINCDGVNADRRCLRRHDDQRHGVQDPGPRRRLSDPRCRTLCRQRSGRRGIDRPRRGQSLRPLFVPDRRRDAARRAPEGRRDGGAQADPERTRSRSGCSTAAASRTSISTSTC